MKFYFCEICGKRITELDIQKGAGRDKKLKGVYCENCAVGVTTMNELPVVVEPAQAVAAKTPAVATRARKGDEDSPRPSPKRLPLRMILMSGSGIVVLAVIALFIAGKDTNQRSTPAPSASVPPPPTQPRVASLAPREPEAPPPAPAKPAPAAIPAENFTVPTLPPEPIAPSPAEKPAEAKTVEVKPPDAKPAEPEQKPTPTPVTPESQPAIAATVNAELIASVLKPLAQHRPADAEVIVRENKTLADATKQELLAALSELQKDAQDYQDQLQRQTGKQVKFQTAKETVEGKLVSIDFPLLRIEKSISMNGESIGSTVVSLNAYELNEASRQSFYHPRDTEAAGWTGRALSAMAGMRVNEAEAAMSHLNENALTTAIATELKHQKIVDTEAQAQAAWTVVAARAKEPPTQARAKQLSADLAAFEKNFGSTQFASSSPVSESLKELKEKAERMAIGLDPRLTGLFKGRIVRYDAPSSTITLEYDFSNKEQTEDFIDSVWASNHDSSGLTWASRKLTMFCAGNADYLLRMPQFVSNTLNIQIDFQNPRASWGAVHFTCGLYGVKSTGKSHKVVIDWDKSGCLISADTVSKAATSNLLEVKQGKLELTYQDKVSLKLNGTTLVEHAVPKSNDHTGFWLGGTGDSGFTITRLQVSGRLDPVWLANALKAAK
jgi:hypothetical protein